MWYNLCAVPCLLCKRADNAEAGVGRCHEKFQQGSAGVKKISGRCQAGWLYTHTSTLECRHTDPIHGHTCRNLDATCTNIIWTTLR